MRGIFVKWLQDDRFPAVLAALAGFIGYLRTLAPSVGWEEDSGELAAAFATLGIPHPSGYPLFTPLAWAFSRLPLGDRPVWRLNLLCALLCAVAVYLFARLFLFLLSDGSAKLFPRRVAAAPSVAGSVAKNSAKGRGKPARASAPVSSDGARGRGGDAWAAAAAALALGFSKTFWTEAVSIEVYAFHLVLTASVLLLFTRALSDQAGEAARPAAGGDRPGWPWHAFALALGLSFAHHLMTVMLAPALLWLYFVTHRFGAASWKRLAWAVPAFAAGLLTNWGNPSDWERFWFHVRGGQYSYQMFASLEGAVDKFSAFLAALPGEVGAVPLAAALAGSVLLYRASRRLFAFAALLFLGNLFFAVNYGFKDPNFYLNAYAALAFGAAFGLAALLRARFYAARLLGAAACLLVAALPAMQNFAAVDQSGNHALDDYTRNVLAPLDPRAVVLTGQYAYFTAPAWYLQRVEGVRPDVLILDTQLLKFPWYYAHLERLAPDLLRDCRPELEAFLRANERFERTSERDSVSFIRHTLPEYQALVRRLVERATADRPVYMTVEVELPPEWGLQGTPAGLVFRLTREAPPRQTPREFAYRPLPEGPGGRTVASYYALGYLNQGLYHAMALGDTAVGKALLRRAISADPRFPPPRQWLARLGG
jgi:hypothetical protein